MKQFKLSLFLILLITISSPYKAFSIKSNSSDDDLLKLKMAVVYDAKVLQISFDGEDAQLGVIQIKNSLNEVILQKKEAELISSPYFDSIDISRYKADTYTITLIVNGKTYTKSIDIK